MLLGSVQVLWWSPASMASSSCFSWALRKGGNSNGSLLPCSPLGSCYKDAIGGLSELSAASPRRRPLVQASLTELPIVWAVRTCVFYALLQVGITGRATIAQDDEEEWLPRQLSPLFGKDKESEHAKELKKVRSKWQTTTKGTLKRRYRVSTKAEGRRLLNSISSLLSDDDGFRDATSHKGCQVRRENAHAESVCGHNVRALFDELPTPHLLVEITAFPVGPITNAHYEKAEKIERVLRTGNSI